MVVRALRAVPDADTTSKASTSAAFEIARRRWEKAAAERRELVDAHVAAGVRDGGEEGRPAVHVALLLTREGHEHDVELSRELLRKGEALALQVPAVHGRKATEAVGRRA